MNNKSAVEFINSIVRNLQVLCHSNVEFSEDVEVIGHIYLSVDKAKKYNYILNEKVCKSDNSSTVFMSNSFHAEHNGDKNDSEGNKQNKLNKAFSSSSSTNDKQQLQSSRNPSFLQKRYHNTCTLSGSTTACDKNIFQQEIHQQKTHNLQCENLHYRHEEPNRKVRKLGETSSSGFKVKQESFTAEPVFFQPQLSSVENDLNDIERQAYNSRSSETNTSNKQTIGDICDDNDFNSSPLHMDVTNIKEEPVDLFTENQSSMNHILNTEVQSDHFEETHTSAMENLKNLSSALTTYSDMSMSPTAQQHQQILSLFQGKRRPNSSYKTLSLADKVKLINAAESNENLSQMKISKMFGISQKSVCNILKLKEKYIKEWNTLSNGPDAEIFDNV